MSDAQSTAVYHDAKLLQSIESILVELHGHSSYLFDLAQCPDPTPETAQMVGRILRGVGQIGHEDMNGIEAALEGVRCLMARMSMRSM
ncbi:MAG: hypothetical protein EOO77_11120 [Oxalobacteraceae bacterium]|nr:MAG: hypothetical protein EOO77_11120 [Oxalobacteraceae bacterium]